jgi:ribonuclease HI
MARTAPAAPDDEAFAGLPTVLARFHITEWDALFITDGSGSTWQRPCGFAAVVHDRHAQVHERRAFLTGGWNLGTVMIAELHAVLLALVWYEEQRGRRLRKRLRRPLVVHVLSDSAVLVDQGNGHAAYGDAGWIWAAISALGRRGYALRFHHLDRETLALNTAVDLGSKQARLALQEIDWSHVIGAVPIEAVNG